MSNILLSIILPCFNVEKYISSCLDSIFNQHFEEDRYEVVCIDDCSSDMTNVIIQRYQQTHSNILIIKQPFNKGPGATRNFGLQHVQGKYLWFIDSDDYIKSNIFTYLLSIMDTNNLEILSFDYCRDNNLMMNYQEYNYNIKIYNGKFFLNQFYNNIHVIFTPWSKIIRLDLIKNNNWSFPEGVFYEDGDSMLKLFYRTERVAYIPIPLYFYRCNPQSTMNNTESGKKYADMVKMGARKLLFSEQIKEESPSLALKIRQDAIWNATAVKRILFLKHTERVKFYKELNHKQFIEIKKGNQSIYLRVLFFYPALINILLYFISPILRLLKHYKNEIRHHHRRSR